ncbi:MAG: hypothetical protein GX536_01625 [Actinobacteria bacterium]|nr:hypothetical protein [Actinomycetota bacterium]
MAVRSAVKRSAGAAVATGALAAAYMLFESQWVDLREEDLAVPGLPEGLTGLSVLHISDVHAAQPSLNLVALAKVVRWAEARRPDLVVLTGDIVDGGLGSDTCLRQLSRLRPPLGIFAVPGNHEYGLSKNPLRNARADRARDALGRVRFLRDECVLLRGPKEGPMLAVCGADYITRGYGLLNGSAPITADAFPLLITHRPPTGDDPLLENFPLVFAGHTHGGQIRMPTPWGMVALHREALPFTEGIHRFNRSVLVISRGVGCTFLPFRLFCRPEAVIHRLRPAESGDVLRRGRR